METFAKQAERRRLRHWGKIARLAVDWRMADSGAKGVVGLGYLPMDKERALERLQEAIDDYRDFLNSRSTVHGDF